MPLTLIFLINVSAYVFNLFFSWSWKTMTAFYTTSVKMSLVFLFVILGKWTSGEYSKSRHLYHSFNSNYLGNRCIRLLHLRIHKYLGIWIISKTQMFFKCQNQNQVHIERIYLYSFWIMWNLMFLFLDKWFFMYKNMLCNFFWPYLKIRAVGNCVIEHRVWRRMAVYE